MAEASINDLLPEVPYDPPKSDIKRRQKLIECVLTRNSKQYLGKAYTKEQINKFSAHKEDKLFSNYEGKLSGQMVKSLNKSIIKMYSMGACAVLGMSNQDVLPGDFRGITKYHSNQYMSCWKQWRTDESIDVLYCSGVYEKVFWWFLDLN